MDKSLTKSLDTKLARIINDPNCPDFIIADAKDADMAFGIAAPGHDAASGMYRTIDQYRQSIRAVVEQGLVDIVLMSLSTSDVLARQEKLFKNSLITPAIRANDTTDIWLAGSKASYTASPSLPFRTASLDHALNSQAEDKSASVDLGLYSITFNNDVSLDRAALQAYREFREEAESRGFRHFLEVFPPNACTTLAKKDVPRFVNDSIVRTLAGVPQHARPIFLKIPYFGGEHLSELVRYDRSLVVGILGGAAGTTLDAFQLLSDAKMHGARLALFGRKINEAEDQLAFIRQLRAIADGTIEPLEAVHRYHDDLRKLKLSTKRDLSADTQVSVNGCSYSS